MVAFSEETNAGKYLHKNMICIFTPEDVTSVLSAKAKRYFMQFLANCTSATTVYGLVQSRPAASARSDRIWY